MGSKRSALRGIMESVYEANNYDEALDRVIHHIESDECPIRESEGKMIITKARLCVSLVDLQKYVTNSWLKYEGMGV